MGAGDFSVRNMHAAAAANADTDAKPVPAAAQDVDKFARLDLNIGIHTGEVWCGNIGSSERMKYGVLGDGVNLAARTKKLNGRYGTSILLTEDTVAERGVRERFVLRPIDLVVVKGKTKPVRLYELMARRENAASSVECLP